MFIKGFKLSLTTLAFLTMTSQVQAREFVDIYKECGLGAMIAPKDPLIAVFTNVTWDLGTTAISTNISSAESCKGKNAKVASFINDSYNEIEKDLASGEGKYIDTLASLSKEESQSKEDFIASVRNNFATIVASNDYSKLTTYQKSEKLYNIIF